MTSLCTKKGILANPRLFVLKLISNKKQLLILILDKSYHNTSISIVNMSKQKYNEANISSKYK